MNKKAIAILGAIFLLIVGTLGFLVYLKYYGNKTETPPITDNGQQTASTTEPVVNNPPPAPSPVSDPSPVPDPSPTPTPSPTPNPVLNPSTIVQLTEEQVVSPVLFFNGSGITYFNRQGDLLQAGFQEYNGQLLLASKKQLGIPAKGNISKILWPAKGNDFIAQSKASSGLPAGQAGKISWSYFNSTTGKYTDLPSQIESLEWMPSGDQIIYVWLDKDKATLNIGNPDSTNYKTIGDMWETDDILKVSPDGSQVLYFESSTASSTNSINSVTTDGKIWKGLVKTDQNFGVLWSPDGKKFLFQKKDPVTLKYELWVYSLLSSEIQSLSLFTTVDKAVWDKDSSTIYVAVPNSGTVAENTLTNDSFFRMDTNSLNKKQYGPGSLVVDGRDLFLNSASDKLFFVNAQDGGLYYLDLVK